MAKVKLSGKALKEELWSSLQDIRKGKMTSTDAHAVSSNAKEIIRTIRTELQILNQAKQSVTDDLLDFTEGK